MLMPSFTSSFQKILKWLMAPAPGVPHALPLSWATHCCTNDLVCQIARPQRDINWMGALWRACVMGSLQPLQASAATSAGLATKAILHESQPVFGALQHS
jgi:hypothetical protein